jgi:putative oxidoreductase
MRVTISKKQQPNAANDEASGEVTVMQNILAVEMVKNPLLLISRILMMVLFINFGSLKLLGYSATVGYFVHQGVPLPNVATPIAIIMELGLGIAIAVGLFVRPLAILLGIYTLATGFLGHPFWSMTGADQFAAEINFFKNVSIMSGLFLLYITGGGRFSLDRMFGLD